MAFLEPFPRTRPDHSVRTTTPRINFGRAAVQLLHMAGKAINLSSDRCVVRSYGKYRVVAAVWGDKQMSTTSYVDFKL